MLTIHRRNSSQNHGPAWFSNACSIKPLRKKTHRSVHMPSPETAACAQHILRWSRPFGQFGKCTPCLAPISASVCSPLIASSATRALNSAVCRLRVTLPISRSQAARD